MCGPSSGEYNEDIQQTLPSSTISSQWKNTLTYKETVRIEEEKKRRKVMGDKTSIGSGMDYDKQKGTFTVNIPSVGKALVELLSSGWPVIRWIFWPVLGIKATVKATMKYPRKAINAFLLIGAWLGGLWAFVMLVGFIIFLCGPDNITPHFNWFCFWNAYLSIALCVMCTKWWLDDDSYY